MYGPIFLFLSDHNGDVFLYCGGDMGRGAAARTRGLLLQRNDQEDRRAPGESAAAAFAMLREREKTALQERKERNRAGGLALLAVGIGLGVFLRLLVRDAPVYSIGLMLGLIGGALLAHPWLFKTKE